MRLEVEVGPVGDPLELAPAPGEEVLDVGRGFRVVGEVLLGVLAEPEAVLGDPEPHEPGEPFLAPIGEPAVGVGRRDEELQLHHLELTGAEDEVPWRDLVAETLTELGDPEGRLAAHRRHHVQEVDEHPLRRLRAQICDGGLVVERADESLEHEVERPRFGEVGGTAVRAGPLDLVGSPALVARPAVDKRVDERLEVAGRLPDLGVRDDRGLDGNDVVPVAHHRAPPGVPHVAEHQRAEGPVVVGRADAAVDLGGGEDEAPSLRKVDDRVEQSRVALGDAVSCGVFLRHNLTIPASPQPEPARGRVWRPRSQGPDYAGVVSSVS